jgi:predicted alpha/beta superfamily hydrolase
MPPPAQRRVLPRVTSPQRGHERDIDVYLPPSYRRSRQRYPVLYMQDGQNLADPDRAFAGTWNLEGALAEIAARGVEVIVVGIPNLGPERLREYTPFVDPKMGGGDGDAYLAYVERTVKPLVDRRFRTRPGRETTGVFGSSLGGLISLYSFFRAPETFGFVGAMSPSLWYAGRAIIDYIQRDGAPPGRIYLDTGTSSATRDMTTGRCAWSRITGASTRRRTGRGGWRRRSSSCCGRSRSGAAAAGAADADHRVD